MCVEWDIVLRSAGVTGDTPHKHSQIRFQFHNRVQDGVELGLVINNGGATKREGRGVQVKFYPYENKQKSGRGVSHAAGGGGGGGTTSFGAVLAILKLGRKKFPPFSLKRGAQHVLPCLGGGGGATKFQTSGFSIL